MHSRLDSLFVLKLPIRNDFDREIIRRKILKLQSISSSSNLLLKIRKSIENQRQYIIEYDNYKITSLRSNTKQKQLELSKSNINHLPKTLKNNSINTRISIMNIYVNSEGDFVYFLNVKEFDICGQQESMLLEKIYTMEWETIVSIVNGNKKEDERDKFKEKQPSKGFGKEKQRQKMPLQLQPNNRKITEPQSTVSPRYLQHLRQASSMSKLVLETKSVTNSLSDSKRFFTSSNKPEPKSKEDFNNLKTIEFKNILNMNQDYMHEFIDVLCDDNPTNLTETSTKMCAKSTRSF